MNKFLKLFFIITSLLIIFISCSNGNNPSNKNSKLNTLSITNAKSLYIAPSASSTTNRTVTSNSNNKLFKITEEGYKEEVKYIYIDEDGNSFESNETLSPSSLYKANNSYLIIGFTSGSVYLVSSTTGKVYSLDTIGLPDENRFYKNSQNIYSDSYNNIFYLKNGVLLKIDVSNPEAVFKSTVSSSTDTVNYFLVDPYGNAIYQTSGTFTCRLAKKNGGFYNLNGIYTWLAPDNNFYYLHFQNSNIEKIIINEDSSVSLETYGSNNSGMGNWPEYSYFVELKNRCIIIPFEESYNEVYNPTSQPRRIETVPRLTSIRDVTNSEDFYFISGNDIDTGNPRLIKINPENDSYEDMYTPGEYEVYKMVYSNEQLTVNALRMNDGKIVMADISMSGNIKIIDEDTNAEIIYLQKLN